MKRIKGVGMKREWKLCLLLLLSLSLFLTIPIASASSSSSDIISLLSERVNPITGKVYGDPLQYEWPRPSIGVFGTGNDESYSQSSKGPGPNTPNILWSLANVYYLYGDWKNRRLGPEPLDISGQWGYVVSGAPDLLVGGYVFVRTVKAPLIGWGPIPMFGTSPTPIFGTPREDYVLALDPYTGEVKYGVRHPGSSFYMGFFGPSGDLPRIVDPNNKYFALPFTGGWAVYEVATGRNLYNVTPTPAGTLLPKLGIAYSIWTGVNASKRGIAAYDHSNVFRPWSTGESTIRTPNNQPIWNITLNKSIGLLCVDTDNKILLFGSWYDCEVHAIRATDGEVLWRLATRSVNRNAVYYEGRFILHGLQRTVTCINSTTGEILWEWIGGHRTYFGNTGAAGDGLFFAHAIDTPTGWIGCWNITTGELLWKLPGYYFIGYFSPVYADGKIYYILADGRGLTDAYDYWADKGAVNHEFSACIDALTGKIIWTMPFQMGHYFGTQAGGFDSHNFIAYGNLYIERFGVLYCIGDAAAKDWPFFRGNVEQTGVTSTRGPTDLSKVRWRFKTGAPVFATPIVVKGKVYVGSYDKNIYCLDAYTGELVWKFPTNYKVEASVAYYNGRIYTGADDGFVYCLDAETGSKIWAKEVGGWMGSLDFYTSSTYQPKSSPIVVNGKVYVGAKSGVFYCFDANNGDILWSYQTKGPILGSPAYYKGRVYVTSTDLNAETYGRLYAFDANTGEVKWVVKVPGEPVFVLGPLIGPASTPSIARNIPGVGDVVLIGTGGTGSTVVCGYNPETGEIANLTTGKPFILKAAIAWATAPHNWVPAYWNNLVFGYYGLNALAWNVSALDPATNETLLQWTQWIVHNGAGSPLVSASISGTYVYFTSDAGNIVCLDAKTGKYISAFSSLGLAPSSPVIWEGKLYFGHGDHYVYCIDDTLTVDTYMWANADKTELPINGTISISGRLYTKVEWEIPEVAYYPSTYEAYSPGIPKATLIVTFIKPDNSMVNLTTTTDSYGCFTISYNPDQAGTWQWIVWYEGKEMPLHSYRYGYAFTDTQTFNVTAPPSTKQAPAWPPEYTYIAVAIVVVIIIVVLTALIIKKRGKQA
ncbi:MAG: PQQ-binding-like beta-propeller repeat protein [Candidatus Bathyarchaeia archaeon]